MEMYLSPQCATPHGGTYQLGAALSRRPARRRMCMAAPFGMGSLSAITADAAAEQIFPQAQVHGSPGHDATTRNQILNSASAGQLFSRSGGSYVPGSGDCAGYKSVGKSVITSVAGTAGGIMLKIGLASGNPIILGIGAAAELASLVFTLIFGHHAKAVAQERGILCAAVPAANDALQVIDQAYRDGYFTAQQASDALNAMPSEFDRQVKAITKGANPMSSGECNAACVMSAALRATVAVKVSQYQDLAAAQTAQAALPGGVITGAVQSVQSAMQSAGLPSWLLLVGGGVLLWKVL